MIEVGELPCRKYRFCLVPCAVASHQFEILRISPALHVGGHSLQLDLYLDLPWCTKNPRTWAPKMDVG
jgi:hypothetical protein